MALLSPRLDRRSKTPTDLEPELHEGDGRIPKWLWWVVATVAIFGAVFAPFQLFWRVG